MSDEYTLVRYKNKSIGNNATLINEHMVEANQFDTNFIAFRGQR